MKDDRASYRLMPQETRLLKLLVEGHNYKTAAAELGLSVHTVSFHMRNIYSKLQCTPNPKPSPKLCATGSSETPPAYISSYAETRICVKRAWHLSQPLRSGD